MNNEISEQLHRTIRYAAAGDTVQLAAMLRDRPELVNETWGYYSPLHFAVRHRQTEAVQLLLQYGADATAKTLNWQDDPLTKAKDRGYTEIAAMLEAHLANNYQVSPAGEQLAAMIRDRQIDELLRQADRFPEQLHAADARGNTPLHWAVLTRSIPLLDALLRRGANLQTRRADGTTPVQLALHGDYWYRFKRDAPPQALRNEWLLIGYLVARGAEYDIWLAAAAGDAETVEAWLQADSSLVHRLNSVERTPLGYAAKYGHETAVQLLLEAGADPNAAERDAPRGSALWSAAAGNFAGCVKLLLAYGADPNAEVEAGGTPLYIATRNGHDAVVRLLYAHGATIQLNAACSLGRIDLVGEIIYADPSLVNGGGDYGPLCMAAGYGQTDIVRLLLRCGAELNSPWFANNYIGYAADAGIEMVQLLLEAGADVNVANWLGVTYLHKAAQQGNVALAELLLRYGADVNAIDEEYASTPLGWSAKYGQTEMVRFLLSQGADPGLPGDEAWAQPLAWARRRGYRAIAAMLE